MDTVNLFIRIDRENIVFLNGILEAYDDLAVLKTIDPDAGLAVIMITPGCEQTVRAILQSIALEAALEIVDPPEDGLARYREQIYGLE